MSTPKYGVLILEGNWGEERDYLTDSRSASRFYVALEDLFNIEEDRPIRFISRPLLKSKFAENIAEFVSLTKRKMGGAVIILSAHGAQVRHKGKRRRVLQAIDGDLNLSVQITKLDCSLEKIVLILDSCEIGEGLDSFQKNANALAVIGFQQSPDWLDSLVFILALLQKLATKNYFSKKTNLKQAAKKAIESMKKSPYDKLTEHLEVEVAPKEMWHARK